MSWFTDNIRDPIEKATGSLIGGGQAVPAVATSNPRPIASGITSSPYFAPAMIVGALILVVMFLKKG